MKLSSYFYDLRSAYQAELDDLVSDSEGKDVLRKRLAEKRSEIGFLVKMMELAPEMVAVVFHQGFRFAKPSVMEHLLSQGGDNLPEWGTLTGAVSLEPWAASLAQTVLREPGGTAFMVVAAIRLVVLVMRARWFMYGKSQSLRSKPTSASQLELASSRVRLLCGSAASSALRAL